MKLEKKSTVSVELSLSEVEAALLYWIVDDVRFLDSFSARHRDFAQELCDEFRALDVEMA